MQDNLPDVPAKKNKEEVMETMGAESEAGIEGEQKPSLVDKLKKLKGNDKQMMQLVLGIILGSLILLGIVVSIIELIRGDEEASGTQEQEMENILLAVEKKPGQMIWLFYEDENKNGKFEHDEQMFSKVSVAARRPGEPEAFRTEASDDSGKVVIDNLDSGKYEVAFLNYGQDQPRVIGDFELPSFYELANELIPTEFKTVVLEAEGYGEVVGVREYMPKKLLILTNGKEIVFYDPKKALVYGKSIIGDEIAREFLIKGKEVFYIKDKELKKFSFEDQVEVMVMDRLYGVKETELAISPELSTVIFTEQDELNYMTKDGHCGDGAIIFEGQRPDIKRSPELVVDFFDEKNFVFAGRVGQEEWEVFRAKCGEKNKFEAEKLEIGDVRALKVLNDKTLFYVDSNGSYFYDLEEKQAVKYTALGVADKVIVSSDKKYIAGMNGGEYIVVDYPAVKASGVEKHYELGVKTLVFNGDEILVREGKTIKRIKLMGDGATEEGQVIELVDVTGEVLGEIEI